MEATTLARTRTAADRILEAIIGALPQFGPTDAIYLEKVTWDQYQQILEEQERLGRRLQISYAAGRLEVLPNLFPAETRKCILRLFVCLLAESFEGELYSLGSSTLADKEKDFGFDPHESFLIQSADRVLFNDAGDLLCSTPPDLVVEVEQPNRKLNRLPMCARAAVPEVWYHDLDKLQFLSLQPNGTYATIDASPAFPLVRSEELDGLLSGLTTRDLTAIADEFRKWVGSIKPIEVKKAKSEAPCPTC